MRVPRGLLGPRQSSPSRGSCVPLAPVPTMPRVAFRDGAWYHKGRGSSLERLGPCRLDATQGSPRGQLCWAPGTVMPPLTLRGSKGLCLPSLVSQGGAPTPQEPQQESCLLETHEEFPSAWGCRGLRPQAEGGWARVCSRERAPLKTAQCSPRL